MAFGKLIDSYGLRISIMILPFSMVAFYISYLIFVGSRKKESVQ